MKLTLTFSLDNDAFAEDAANEAARVLREASYEISGRLSVNVGDMLRLYDINGNRIGFLSVED